MSTVRPKKSPSAAMPAKKTSQVGGAYKVHVGPGLEWLGLREGDVAFFSPDSPAPLPGDVAALWTRLMLPEGAPLIVRLAKRPWSPMFDSGKHAGVVFDSPRGPASLSYVHSFIARLDGLMEVCERT